ncbi:MAG TPA: glycosyltransferase [Bryobacteraceae bacterium]|nr:glycosyltransferase [Bryobacteraceae bacterium]
MKITIFGLTLSSSWGNGHATLWRALCRSLIERGHDIHFFERDVPYYAAHRDLNELKGGALHLYSDWQNVRDIALKQSDDSDVVILTSYFPDMQVALETVLPSGARARVYYDLDTPVTVKKLDANEPVDYFPECGLGEFDLVLSYTGGPALSSLRELGARRAEPLYGSVDPKKFFPVSPEPDFASDFCFLGTYATDRQEVLERLFLEPAARLPERLFRLAGTQYPQSFSWRPNIFFARHLAPGQHPAFYCSSRMTLNVTRGAMAEMGFCPSGRLFEAAACGVPIISDGWAGLDQFFAPGREILIATGAEDVVQALRRDPEWLAGIGAAGRRHVLKEHTADIRAEQLEALLENVLERNASPACCGVEL